MASPIDAFPALGRMVSDRLDPLLTAHGFLAGQAGGGEQDVRVTFCVAGTDARSRLPRLVAATGLLDGGCLDLIVAVSAARVTEVRLEGIGLDELLVTIGRGDLVPRSRALLAVPLGDGLDRLHALLAALLDTAADEERHD